MNKNLSILLPHSDDEVFILPYIEAKLAEKCNIHVFFITTDLNPQRKLESEKVFSAFQGVHIYHFGLKNKILDGKLSEQASLVLTLLEEIPMILESNYLVTPMYEGGHKDHDELFKIGHALSVKLDKPQYCFSLYNAYQTPLVRVATLFQGPVRGQIEVVRFNISKGIKYLRNIFNYKSQYVILAVLFPGLIRTFLLKRQIEILHVSSFDPLANHPGALFYNNGLKSKLKSILGIA